MSTTEESPQDRFFDPPIQQRGIDSLKLMNLTVNIQTELDLDRPNPIEPAPPYTSPCYDPASSLRKRNDAQGKGWLDFSSLNLANGSMWADMEDNVSGTRTGGSKG